MDLSTTKLELIELILSSSNSKLLKEAKDLFVAAPQLNTEDYKVIDERRKAYQKNKSSAMPWDDLKQQLLKQKR